MDLATTLPSTRASLSARDVVKRYRGGSTPALDGVTLDVPTGALTALVGPNGAGKSTLMRAWLGFERVDRGHVRVTGVDPAADPATALAQVAYVPQGSSLYRDLTVRDHLALAGCFRPSFDTAMAVERLSRIQVPLSRKIASLSGGQQAQVSLALALATRAPILLLDEPLASLDPLARREFMLALMTSVRSDGRTAVLSSHVVADVEEAADRLVLIVDGQIRLDLDATEVVHTHAIKDTATQEVVAVIPSLRGRDRTIVRTPPGSDAERPTLEDVVMAYLLASRRPGPEGQ